MLVQGGAAYAAVGLVLSRLDRCLCHAVRNTRTHGTVQLQRVCTRCHRETCVDAEWCTVQMLVKIKPLLHVQQAVVTCDVISDLFPS